MRAIGAGIAIWRRYWDVLNHTHNLEAECTSRGIALPTWEESKLKLFFFLFGGGRESFMLPNLTVTPI